MITFPQTFPVACHTDTVGPGSTFVVIRGMREDGAQYILQALEKGATNIVIEESSKLSKELLTQIEASKANLIRVSNTRLALAELSAQTHNFPALKLKIIGITGTKGKSTTTFLVEHMLRTAGYKTALLSTIKNSILGNDFPTQLTTQQPDYIHTFLALCVAQGVEWVVMEVAAQAFSLHRVAGIMFDAAIVTNFSSEHAEFYQTMDDYFAAKAQILEHLKPDAPVLLNKKCTRVASLEACAKHVHFFGLNTVTVEQNTLAGVIFTHNHTQYSCPSLVGLFNIENLCACLTLGAFLKISTQTMQKAFLSFDGVPGRLVKYVLPNGATACIDYAHNPSSYEAMLSMMHTYTKDLIVVFGAGGDRDNTKRPIMGAIAATYADHIFLTTDNPRSEEPATIVAQILAGIPSTVRHKVHIELDRDKAIHLAYAQSTPTSIILLLGKGPDEYQLAHGIKSYFSEREILQKL